MDDRNFNTQNEHEVLIVNRELVTIKGVMHVDSFDDQEVVLDSDYGSLTIRGDDLTIKQLDVQDGSFAVEGLVTAVQYSSSSRSRSKGKSKGFLDRLFR